MYLRCATHGVALGVTYSCMMAGVIAPTSLLWRSLTTCFTPVRAATASSQVGLGAWRDAWRDSPRGRLARRRSPSVC